MFHNLFIDTEFDGFGGKLISMAIVDEKGSEFYEVVEDTAENEWVRENVLPVLGKAKISKEEFQKKLGDFLVNYWEGFEIIADWPDDIKFFMEAMITGAGRKMAVAQSIVARVDDRVSSEGAAVRHNALSDARAIMKSWRKHEQDMDNQ